MKFNSLMDPPGPARHRAPCKPWAGRVAAAAFALALAAPALAQQQSVQQEHGLGAIEVTATRVGQPLADALPSVTLITRDQIDQTQSRDLVELLGRQVGVEMARRGGQGAQSSLFLRGTNSNDVLVLVDGVRVNSVLDGAANLGGIATDSIDHIEVARGNLSSLYGSEAIGGVIQIFTRRGTGPGGGVTIEAGQGANRDATAYASVPAGTSLLTLSVGVRSQKAFSAIDTTVAPAANPDLDGNRNRNGALHWSGTGLGTQWSAWAWGNRNDTDWDDLYDSSATIPSSRATQVEHASLFGYGIRAERVLGPARLTASAAVTQDNSANGSNVPFSYDDNVFSSRNRQFSLQSGVTLARGLDWNSGVEVVDQRGASTTYDPSFANALTAHARHVASLWTGVVGQAGAHQVQANVRYDRYSDAGNATTGLLGWGWSVAPAWKLTAQAASAFRAPSFNDLYYPVYGNPSLRPERARSAELGLRWARGGGEAAVALYRNRVTDLIEGLAPDYVSRNVARAAVDGCELQGGERLGGLHVTASVALARPRDLDSGQVLVRRARAVAGVAADYAEGPWRLAGDLHRTGGRDDFDINTSARLQLPGYTLARIAAERSLTSNLRVNLRVENLFNARYELVDGYNTPGRTIVAGLGYRI